MAPPVLTDDRAALDKDALLRLLAGRRDELIAFLRRRAPSDVEPEDLLQQAFLTAARKLDQLRDPDLVVAWFYRILRRTLADHQVRRATRRDKLPILEADAHASEMEDETALCACSLALIDRLPAPYAEVLRRVDVGDEELAEVAASIGTTTNNVAVRLHRARKALRERLFALCGTTSLRSCQDCGCEGGAPARSAS